MFSTVEIVSEISYLLADELQQTSQLVWQKKGGNEDIVMLHSDPSPYCDVTNSDPVLFWLHPKGMKTYFRFHSKYRRIFDAAHIAISQLKSQPNFIRVAIDNFVGLTKFPDDVLKPILHTIYMDAFHFEPFGCCHRYVECSDMKKCLHPNLNYATVCQYRKHLEAGRIFYGKNKNISN